MACQLSSCCLAALHMFPAAFRGRLAGWTDPASALQVYLQPWGAQEPVVAQGGNRLTGAPSQEGSPGGSPAAGRGMLLERWSMHYQPDPQDGSLQRSRSQLARLDPPAIYKRMVRAEALRRAPTAGPLCQLSPGTGMHCAKRGPAPIPAAWQPWHRAQASGTWQRWADPHLWRPAALPPLLL